MTESPAIIAVDIDGTLLTSSGTVLPGTRAEFARARDAGATIALASGRPVVGLRRLVRMSSLDDRGFVLIGVNGAMSVDADTGEVVARRPLALDVVADILELAEQHDVLVMLCSGDRLVVDRPGHPQVSVEADGNELAVEAVPSLADAVSAGADTVVDKVLMHADPARLRPFGDVFADRFAGVTEFAFSAPFYFEATARGVDKGSALADLAAARGVELSRCVAFGDNGNDLPMLRAAGLGVAMANSTAAVRAAADRVTASNDDDGIAVVLRELFGGGVPAPAVPEPTDVEPLHALDLRELGGSGHPDDAPEQAAPPSHE
ncbi:Cof-type HAD-IIB family hydrolase [Agilicoccus flavus]|uniref:Cof-type HAD-IIB family hydrolase n=1 Tax=Agilicoccus flavus TaxID=2775968 RepID=UPI001CF6A016|nr:Cof-type HAD-IIB family hydrolase [Agilicoccus flavus]